MDENNKDVISEAPEICNSVPAEQLTSTDESKLVIEERVKADHNLEVPVNELDNGLIKLVDSTSESDAMNADLNCNVNESKCENTLESPAKPEDKLEMAVKQSELMLLDDDDDLPMQYKSATDVYQKAGAEEALLSESMIVNTTDDGTIVIVTAAEQQHSPSNIIVYETSNYMEIRPGSSEIVNVNNLVVADETDSEIKIASEHVTEEQFVAKPADNTEQVTEVIETAAVVDSQPMEVVEHHSVETHAAERLEEVSDEPVNEIQAENIQEVTDVGNEQVKNVQSQLIYETIGNEEVAHVIIENDLLEDTNNEEVSFATNESAEENLSGDITENASHNKVDTNQPSANHLSSYGSVEQQISAIVKQDDHEVAAEKSLSVVDAITRDFDESDSDDTETEHMKVESAHSESKDNAEQVDHNDCDPSNAYVVQPTEEIVVLENEQSENADTIEVTVISENENDSQESTPAPVKSKKSTRVPQIPSHVLGRNIDNPSDDPFRNGKVPPKPRLGVKIPYRNLTSQIVSKDEIAQEILERQRNKFGDLAQPQGDILFAKKLTQRLARKIAPAIPVQQETRRLETTTSEKINNSDLIAILEGDGDEIDTKKQDGNSSEMNLLVAKSLERQIALKQLNELPKGRGRLRKHTLERPIFNKLKPQIPEKIQEPRQAITAPAVISAENAGDATSGESTADSIATHPILESDAKDSQAESDGTKDLKTDSKNTESVKEVNIIPDSQTTLTSKISKEIKTSPESKSKPEIKIKNVDAKPKTVESKTSNVENKEVKPKDTNERIDSDSKKVKDTEAKEKKTETKTSANDTKLKKQDPKSEAKPRSLSNDMKSTEIKTKSPENVTRPAEVAKSDKISTKTKDAIIKDFAVDRKFSSNVPIKTYTRKRKSTDDIIIVSSIPEKRSTNVQKEITPTYVTKSSRIIKRKVIWDPDEPSPVRRMALKSPKLREHSPKLEKQTAIKSLTPGKIEKKFSIKKSPTKSPDKYKKRLSEVDRLLMDEGAVNMLYAFKNTDEAPKKKKATVISLDRAQRELLNKTNELKRDLTNSSDKESPKSLRKKESPISLMPKKGTIPAMISRKKSKDSTQSSTNSRPTSPGLIYLHHAEASRIIRRHSSSSYSSIEGEEQLDEPPELTKSVEVEAVVTEKVVKRKNTPASAESPKAKKVKNVDKDNETLAVVLEKMKVNQAKNFNKLIEVEVASMEDKYSKYKTFSVKKMDHLIQIILLPSVNNQVYLTPEILQELILILKELQKDNECHVVLVSSSAVSFCHGINYKTLVCDKEQTRKLIAKKLATCLSMFLKTLSTFSKIIIAGVHGDTVGLGVTMLPLFDMVIASDTATFSIPNARLGCAVEGGSLLSLPHLMHNVLVSELLYASRKLIAAEALRLGMVTRVLWPDKFQQELMSIVKMISNHSLQFMQVTKKQLRHHMLANVDSALTREVDTLIEHWTSVECQRSFGVQG